MYLDTSAAVKLFFEEKGSSALKDYLVAAGSYSLRSSMLLRIETESAIRRKVRESGQTANAYYVEIQTWRDFDARRFQYFPVNEDIAARVKDILNDPRLSGPLRTLDAIHLGTFLTLREWYSDTVLIASDKRLIESAHQLGVLVFDPERPSQNGPVPRTP